MFILSRAARLLLHFTHNFQLGKLSQSFSYFEKSSEFAIQIYFRRVESFSLQFDLFLRGESESRLRQLNFHRNLLSIVVSHRILLTLLESALVFFFLRLNSIFRQFVERRQQPNSNS